MDDWIPMKSKFANKCMLCGEMVEVGTSIKWKKGSGIIHDPKCVEDDPPTDNSQLVIIDDVEWQDFKKYDMDYLSKIKNCQRCGIPLNVKDQYINVDRRTCEDCFSAKV